MWRIKMNKSCNKLFLDVIVFTVETTLSFPPCFLRITYCFESNQLVFSPTFSNLDGKMKLVCYNYLILGTQRDVHVHSQTEEERSCNKG